MARCFSLLLSRWEGSYLLEVLRNMARRRTRTLLTIMGIFTGVLALTVMGALAERINHMVAGSERFFTQQIAIYPGRSFSARLVVPQQMEHIRTIEGVDQVVPVIELTLGLDSSGFVMGPPPMLQGVDLSSPLARRRHEELPLRSGRPLRETDESAAVAGSDVAAAHGWRVGQKIELRGESFELVGILDRLMTLPDQHVYVSLEDARRLLRLDTGLLSLLGGSSPLQDHIEAPGTAAEADLPKGDAVRIPELLTSALLPFDPGQIATSLFVSWKPSTDPHELSNAIQQALPELRVLSPVSMRRMLTQAMTMFNLIVVGSAAIALVVGGLSVVNTMTMSVTERRSEIGLKKALGAPNRSLFSEYVLESALLGLLGGLLGVALGSLMVYLLNAWADEGTPIFLITPRLLLFTLLFATLLGAVSGLLPAMHVMRMHPVDALRGE